jgi:hypothetical protein
MERWHTPSADKYTLTGTEEVMANLDRYIGSMPEVVMQELEVWAETILQESLKEVPWDTTHLRQTGTIEPFDEGDTHGYQIGYNATSFSSGIMSGWYGAVKYAGEDDYNYGLRQHEDLTLHHPKPGTKAKFLEDPFNRIKSQVIPGIVDTINSYFTAGVPSMSGMMQSRRLSLGNLGGRFI